MIGNRSKWQAENADFLHMRVTAERLHYLAAHRTLPIVVC